MSVALGVTTLVLGILLVIMERKRSEIMEKRMRLEIAHIHKRFRSVEMKMNGKIETLREEFDERILALREDLHEVNVQVEFLLLQNAGEHDDDGNDSGYESE